VGPDCTSVMFRFPLLPKLCSRQPCAVCAVTARRCSPACPCHLPPCCNLIPTSHILRNSYSLSQHSAAALPVPATCQIQLSATAAACRSTALQPGPSAPPAAATSCETGCSLSFQSAVVVPAYATCINHFCTTVAACAKHRLQRCLSLPPAASHI
jgi:hypothetical protein